VAVKIEHAVYQSAKMYGRHFDDKDEIYSHISRQSIDVLKVRWDYSPCRWVPDRHCPFPPVSFFSSFQASFKEDVTPGEWQLIKALKPVSSPLPGRRVQVCCW